MTSITKLEQYATVRKDWERWAKNNVKKTSDLANMRRMMVLASLTEDYEFDAMYDSDVRALPANMPEDTKAMLACCYKEQIERIRSLSQDHRDILKTAISDILIQDYGDCPEEDANG